MERREDIYGASEAARVLNVTPGRIRQLLESGELEGFKDGGRWKVPQRAVHARLEEFPRRMRETATDAPENVREMQSRVEHLQHQLGRLERQTELEEITRSTLEGQLDRERERADEERDRLLRERDEERRRADELQRQLDEEQRRGFWSRLFGGGG